MNPRPTPPTSRRLNRITLLAGILPFAAATACGDPSPSTPSTPNTPTPTMSAETYAVAIQTLSSDEFEGRGPSTPGEETTVAYLVDQFQAAGLEPGNGDSFFQDVPLVALTEQGQPQLTVQAADTELSYSWSEDFVAWTKRVVDSESITDSEMVFVGYGVVAPEYGWNDYEGVDAVGKTVVILVNDPGVRDPGRSGLPRQFDDLLRPLDLQVRGSGPAGRGGGDRRPRGSGRGIPVGGRERKLDRSAVHPGRGRRQHGPGSGRRMGPGPGGARDLRGGRARLRRAGAVGGPARFQRRPTRSLGVGGGLQRHPALRVKERARTAARA